MCPQPPVRHRTKAIGHQHPGTTDPHPQPELTEGGVEMLRQGQLSMGSGGLVVETTALCQGNNVDNLPIPIGSMYGIYANIWGILMVNVTIYGIHGSYGICIPDHYGRESWNKFFDDRRVSTVQWDVRSHGGTQSYHLSDLFCEEPNGLGYPNLRKHRVFKWVKAKNLEICRWKINETNRNIAGYKIILSSWA